MQELIGNMHGRSISSTGRADVAGKRIRGWGFAMRDVPRTVVIGLQTGAGCIGAQSVKMMTGSHGSAGSLRIRNNAISRRGGDMKGRSWGTDSEIEFLKKLKKRNPKGYELYKLTFWKRGRWGAIERWKVFRFLEIGR